MGIRDSLFKHAYQNGIALSLGCHIERRSDNGCIDGARDQGLEAGGLCANLNNDNISFRAHSKFLKYQTNSGIGARTKAANGDSFPLSCCQWVIPLAATKL